MSALELYESTRGVWKLGPRRLKAKFAFAVFEGVVRAVYRIDAWYPAGSTEYQSRSAPEVQREGRWEFIGAPADEVISAAYVDRSVRSYFRQGQQSPIVYVNC
jgi:hypothetical protein